MLSLNYLVENKNINEPPEKGITELEIIVNQIYELLKKYRIHEVII